MKHFNMRKNSRKAIARLKGAFEENNMKFYENTFSKTIRVKNETLENSNK